jgi:hypothetical protein
MKDIGKATNGSSGEAERTKNGETGDDKACRQHDRAEAGKGVTAVEIAVQAAAVLTAAMAVRAAQRGTRRLAEAGRGGF